TTASTVVSRARSLIPSFFFYFSAHPRLLHSFPTRRSSDLRDLACLDREAHATQHDEVVPFALEAMGHVPDLHQRAAARRCGDCRSEEHTSELQSLTNLVCRLLLEKKKRLNSLLSISETQTT